MKENIGCAIAQRLTAALIGKGIPYQELADIIYSELTSISAEMDKDDWLEFPNGTTFVKTYEPREG